MKRTALLALAIGLVGCAAQPVIRPVVDMKGVDTAAYEEDLLSCNNYAGATDPAADAINGAIAGAMVGAAFGAITGNAYGMPGYGAKVGAQYGALAGGVQAGVTSSTEQVNIVKRCMYGRGYNVLN